MHARKHANNFEQFILGSGCRLINFSFSDTSEHDGCGSDVFRYGSTGFTHPVLFCRLPLAKKKEQRNRKDQYWYDKIQFPHNELRNGRTKKSRKQDKGWNA
ncbi:hypothetical protein [Sediminibacterium ginsengisoli]|uniref:hypothetical protein n=1 Tax=Sediminibacterium ginsengisoli TaxID=413434 RepID=UPI001590B38B|nr:hypothetical protein [Sediminibacterium ginsengisoli]